MKNLAERWIIKEESTSFVIIASFFTLLSMFVFLVTEPVLSGAGDINISDHLASSKIKPGFFFISPVLASFLRTMNKVINANWWSVFSVIVMFVGLFIFLWFINKRNRDQSKVSRVLLTVLLALVFWEAILRYEVNFTQTAVIAGLSGIILITDCCYEKECRHRRITAFKIVLGIGFLLLAGSVRWKALFLMLPFGIMCLLYIFAMPLAFSNMALSLRSSFDNKSIAIGLAVLMTLTVFVSNATHQLYGIVNPDLGEYVEANALREDICDYSERYPGYEEAEAEYRELDITPSWINMVNNFLTGDLNHFASHDLRKMVNMRQESKMTIGDFMESLRGHWLLWLDIVLLVGCIVLFKGIRNTWLPFAGCMFAFILCALYFVHIGRFGWRVTNGCILACIMSFIAMSSHAVYEYVPEKNRIRMGWRPLALSVILCFAWGIAVKMEKESFSLPVARATDEDQAAVLEYINSNPDIVYVGADKTLQFYRTYNMWTFHEPEYLKNAILLSAHFIIGEEDTLLEAGVENLFDDMLEEPDILLKYSASRNTIIYNYIRDYYDPCVSITVVDSYGEAKFLRYTKPISPNTVKDYGEDINVRFEMTDDCPDDEAVIAAIKVSYDISERGGTGINMLI